MEKFKKLTKEEMKKVLGGDDEAGYEPENCAPDGDLCLWATCCHRCMGDAHCGTVG